MVFEHIEKLKQQYTDKYVVVDGNRPELARFEGQTGIIKTVNMNGRALVQFDAWNNIAWYDIDLDFLKVVPKPELKPVQEKVSEKAPPAAAHAKGAIMGNDPGATVRDIKAPGSKPGVAAKPSTADILAAARAKKGDSPAPPAAKPASAGKMSTADILAAARAKAAGGEAPPAKPAAESKKPSTADILAAARANKGSVPTIEPAPEETATEEPAEIPQPAPAKVTRGAPAKASGALPTTTAEKIAWCRAHDAK